MLCRTLLLAVLLGATATLLTAQKFYDDDPIAKMPPPMNVETIEARRLSDFYDFFLQTFGKPGEAQPKQAFDDSAADPIPAQAVNTLGEVPDSTWFTNRIGSRPYSIEEAVRGPGNHRPPSQDGPWKAIAAKTEGVTPGFTIEDADGRRYILKFDPATNPEMTTGADAVGSVFFHALGYNVPENYIVNFDADQLIPGPGALVTDLSGNERLMLPADIAGVLDRVPRNRDDRLRGLASHFLEGRPVGEFQYHGTRPDDPNDVFPHEHRRDLRGLFVFAAWLGHDDSRAINTLDMLVEEGGRKFVKHHLIDFGSILGSASVYANSSRSGNERLFSFKPAAIQVITLGLLVPRWARPRYRTYPSVGLFDYHIFDPEKYRPEQRNPAFENRLPDDTYWAAKKVMAFTDDHIRALVKAGQYTDPEAQAWLVECLINRRDIVGRTYFEKVLPLDNFRVESGQLKFDDLAVQYNFQQPRQFKIQWSAFNNETETHTPIEAATTFDLPTQVNNPGNSPYLAARIKAQDDRRTVTVYLRRGSTTWQLAGIDRTW